MSVEGKLMRVSGQGRMYLSSVIQDRWQIPTSTHAIGSADLDTAALLVPAGSPWHLVEALCPSSELRARAIRRVERYLSDPASLPQTPPQIFDLFTTQSMTEQRQVQLPADVSRRLGSPVEVIDLQTGVLLTPADNNTNPDLLVPTTLFEEGAWMHDPYGRLSGFYADAYRDWVEERAQATAAAMDTGSNAPAAVTTDQTTFGRKVAAIIKRDTSVVVARLAEEQTH